MIDDIIDVFADCKFIVGLTNLVFYNINKMDSRFLRQLAPNITYGKQRDQNKREIKTILKAVLIAPRRRCWHYLL